MKVGDLVKIHPACCDTYIIVERLSESGGGKLTLWLLHDGDVSIRMTERFMEVVSESR